MKISQKCIWHFFFTCLHTDKKYNNKILCGKCITSKRFLHHYFLLFDIWNKCNKLWVLFILIRGRPKIFFDTSKCQSCYILAHSKGVFIKERSKINQIWGLAGQIKSFCGPYVVHAWYRECKRFCVDSIFYLALLIYLKPFIWNKQLVTNPVVPKLFRFADHLEKFGGQRNTRYWSI